MVFLALSDTGKHFLETYQLKSEICGQPLHQGWVPATLFLGDTCFPVPVSPALIIPALGRMDFHFKGDRFKLDSRLELEIGLYGSKVWKLE